MDEPLDAGRELYKRTELGDARHRAFHGCTHWEPLLDVHPGVLFRVLQRQADLARRFVDPLDSHADLLPLLHDLTRMLHALPGKLADVNQPIEPPQIDERPEVVNLA